MNLYEDFTARTDLADENELFLSREAEKECSGVTAVRKKIGEFPVSIMNITDKKAEKITGKPMGRYVTVEVGKIWMSDKKRFCDASEVIAAIIRDFIPENGSCMLAALGNKSIIADAIGPFTAESFIVTRHIKNSDKRIFDSLKLRETLCISPGVLGNTGIEAAQIIKGAVSEAKPSFIIAVDSLASRKLSRLATTVQICDSGIIPGSGINNSRSEISKSTVGVPVIAIGVPTVVDVITLSLDIIKGATDETDRSLSHIAEKISLNGAKGFFVTPKETDHIIKDTSKLIGYSLNLALHEGITHNEIDELLM